MVTDDRLDHIASELLLVLDATGLTHAAQLEVLRRLRERMAAGRALCSLCEMLVPLEGEWRHEARCGLPCTPPLVAAAGEAHRDMDDCPRCAPEAA